MAARRPFWKWHRCKSIGFCLWLPSICIWNLKLKFQSKLDLCSGNHVVYRQTDRRTDWRTDKVNPVYPPSNFVGWGYKNQQDFNRKSSSTISTLHTNCRLETNHKVDHHTGSKLFIHGPKHYKEGQLLSPIYLHLIESGFQKESLGTETSWGGG